MNDMMGPSLEASLDDLKVVYRVLRAHLAEHPELEDNPFFASLGRLLEAQAEAEGVDVGDDAEWESWLEEPSEPVEEEPRDLLN